MVISKIIMPESAKRSGGANSPAKKAPSDSGWGYFLSFVELPEEDEVAYPHGVFIAQLFAHKCSFLRKKYTIMSLINKRILGISILDKWQVACNNAYPLPS